MTIIQNIKDIIIKKLDKFLKIFKFFALIFFFTIFILISFFINLGKILDISEEPIKSDVILCLGGGTGERINRTISLFNENFVKNKIIISDTIELDLINSYEKLKKAEINDNFIITKFGTKNTLDELLFAESIMKINNYKSILIISDEPHTRRIHMLINNFTNFNKSKISYRLVGSNIKWWNKNKFYLNKHAISFSLLEFLKIIYNFTIYTLKSNSIIDDNLIDSFSQYKHNFTINMNAYVKKIFD